MDIEKLRQLIKRAQGDRSQNEYAMHCGIASATITKGLNGERILKADSLKKLASRAHNGVTYKMLLEAAGYINENFISPDDELWELRREMAERDEMKTLFSLSKGATKEDILLINEMLKRMRKESGYQDE